MQFFPSFAWRKRRGGFVLRTGRFAVMNIGYLDLNVNGVSLGFEADWIEIRELERRGKFGARKAAEKYEKGEACERKGADKFELREPRRRVSKFRDEGRA